MQDRYGDHRQFKRTALPTLASRDSHPASSALEQPSPPRSTSTRSARLSHRSRAGCWTCRGRKVKCDEIHPRCGPCTRLNRECDWDHRWNFSDATSTTQGKYANVNILGNAVWDPDARRATSQSPRALAIDPLPDFAALKTDEDRERKAETQRPGTFGVVVTPASFSELPEYQTGALLTDREASSVSSRDTLHIGGDTPKSRGSGDDDPNTVVLGRFEDVVLPVSAIASAGAARLGAMRSSDSQSPRVRPISAHQNHRPDDFVMQHFREHIMPCLVHPQLHLSSTAKSSSSGLLAIEAEAARFPPLYHAICALVKLNLSYTGHSSLEEAMQHYHEALAVQTPTSSPTDLLSDGVFFRHYLLFIYDICIPLQGDEGAASMWAEHLNHLRRIAVLRFERQGREPHALTIWNICELDMYACLMGRGHCEFLHTVLQHQMIPPLEQHLSPLLRSGGIRPDDPLRQEAVVFMPVLRLLQGIVLRVAKLAQAAQSIRAEISRTHRPLQGMYPRWRNIALDIESDIDIYWRHAYADTLHQLLPLADGQMPDRVRAIFDKAILLYHAAILYSRTSMFPNQRHPPTDDHGDPSNPAVVATQAADNDVRALAVLAIASGQVETDPLSISRHTVFPVFMAGIATGRANDKARAVSLLHAYEGRGIGQNTARTARLLAEVYLEQQRIAEMGGRMDSVDWFDIAQRSRLWMVNCGL